ncbi:hypothetical protein AYO20_04126 [Fonsecaea nubica]|uniref:Major facilitator superfamily (MFS) profile domain-containing protein n=1 Tax=Fonsecaea nubica TaxID=856822 RepID=A0A178D2U6_9EURO|nr:hypothetical protein AYO20_04126 [Fonsecaea nubica]OAL36510.1 hypothetical protein AYO20_04126 [Fonsecaea nubica]
MSLVSTKSRSVEHLEKEPMAESTIPDEESALPPSTPDWTPEEERALVQKLDWRVFPMLCVVFGLSLLDRTNISNAYIAGMAHDLELTVGTRYSISLLVFFIGGAPSQGICNLIIRKLGAQVWMSFLILSWGACVFGMGFVHRWETLTLCRTLLGVFESGLLPGAIFIIGSWYCQFETAGRTSMFYMASLIASAFGPVLAYALSLVRVGDGDYARGWRWIFIVEGIITIVCGVAAPWLLIDFPERATWLTPRQKYIAQARLQQDRASTEFIHPSFIEALRIARDWKLLVYSFQYFVAASCVYSLAYFKPIILNEGMGFSYVLAQVLGAPPYVFTIIASIMLARLSDKWRIRWPFLCSQALTAVVGMVLVLYTHIVGVQYFGMSLAIFGVQCIVPGTLAYSSSNTAEVRKKGVVSAIIVTAGAAGGVCGSTVFRSQDKPRYLPGMWTTIALLLSYACVTFALSMHLKRENRLADEGKRPCLENVEGFRYAP